MEELTWLHLADLRFRGEAIDEIHNAMLADARRTVASFGSPALICVTGNVAAQGEPAAYHRARWWMEQLAEAVGTRLERIFCIPGPGDLRVERGDDNLLHRIVHQHLRRSPRDLDQALETEDSRALLARKRQEFDRFTAMLPGHPRGWPAWEQPLDEHGEIRVLGLDGTLIDFGEGRGQFALGSVQLGRVKATPPGALLIVLLRTPLGAEAGELWTQEGSQLLDLLQQRPHLLLTSPGSKVHPGLPEGSLLQGIAGQSPAGLTCSWGRLDRDGLRLEIRTAGNGTPGLVVNKKRQELPRRLVELLPGEVLSSSGELRGPGGPFREEKCVPRPELENLGLRILKDSHLVVAAPPRFGKTWFIERLLHIWQPPEGIRVVRCGPRPQLGLWRSIFFAMAFDGLPITKLDFLGRSEPGNAEIDSVLRQAHEATAPGYLVMFIDDMLLEQASEWERSAFFARVRNWNSEAWWKGQPRQRLIVSVTTQELSLHLQTRGSASRAFNKVRLPDLGEAEARGLARRYGVKWDSKAFDGIASSEGYNLWMLVALLSWAAQNGATPREALDPARRVLDEHLRFAAGQLGRILTPGSEASRLLLSGNEVSLDKRQALLDAGLAEEEQGSARRIKLRYPVYRRLEQLLPNRVGELK